ncbi:HWE histidine kinase domain-containing protein [Glacieibacterium sp.]|uniref:HWE histidine kinase domain-containing protein n=1 Tax=Glacieibacterium sp. TaxID=2860237 RepID=UPI003B00621A
MTAGDPGNSKPNDTLPFAVDLTNCDREPIHLAGSIQPAGFLIAFASDWLISRASENVDVFLDVPDGPLPGTALDAVFSAEAVHTIRNRLSTLQGPDAMERAFAIRLQDDRPPFDLAIYMAGSTFVLECEPSEGRNEADVGTLVRSMVARIRGAQGFADFTREAARQVRALTGFDRVMVYRFDADGCGEVIAESLRGRLESFMGLRYPASDIPKQARALYERNLLRLIADVDAVAVPIRPQLDALGEPLDLSMSVLRAVSPIHLQYLRNMGVRASMSISIMRRGRLWGLIACHHTLPRHIGFERRTTADLFVQMFSLLLESRERDEETGYEARTRLLHNQLMAAMASEESTSGNLVRLADKMAELVPCDGIAVWVDGAATLMGSTPTERELAGLVEILNRGAASEIFACTELGKVEASARRYAELAAGVLVIPVSRIPRDYVMFFRREVKRTIKWAGNPDKPVEVLAGSATLTPRQSFAAWRETVRGQCAPWTEAELRAAEALRITLLEVVLRLTDVAARDRREAAERQELLIAELNHRVRNILGIVSGLVSQSRASVEDVETFAAVLGGRVQALARAHDQLTTDDWGSALLDVLIGVEAEAYLSARPHCVGASGPAVKLSPRAFTTLALVVHELITNSAKYGALSVVTGRVAIDWRLDNAGALVIDWRESGGPLVTPPKRRGFGTTIIERSVPHELGGLASVDHRTAGLVAQFTIPAGLVSPAEAARSDREADATESSPIETALSLSGTVLLVEDSMVIALDAEEMLLALGATRVDIAASTEDAMAILDFEKPTFAVLDVNLGAETSFPIAGRLRKMGVPTIFATGYGEDLVIPLGYSNTPIVKKPYTATAIVRALRSLARRLPEPA